MRLPYTRRDVLTGLLVYPLGDSVAALLTDQFTWLRVFGVMAVGVILYALEIPAYFRWIDRRTKSVSGIWPRALGRTALALLYFNPVWIARHLLLLRLFSGAADSIGWSLLQVAAFSWVANIPIAVAGNYIIQARLPLRWRFLGSALFSGLLAVYYPLSEVLFSGQR